MKSAKPMPTSLDAEFSRELGVELKEGEKSAKALSTSNFSMVVQDRLEVGEPNAEFGIVCALFIVGRRFADFSSSFHCTGQIEANGPFVDFYIRNSGLKLASGLPTSGCLKPIERLPTLEFF